jgi:hypothetical protein
MLMLGCPEPHTCCSCRQSIGQCFILYFQLCIPGSHSPHLLARSLCSVLSSFAATRLDISDEFKQVISTLRGHDDKVGVMARGRRYGGMGIGMGGDKGGGGGGGDKVCLTWSQMRVVFEQAGLGCDCTTALPPYSLLLRVIILNKPDQVVAACMPLQET